MRKFLTICAILLSVGASAQWQQTGSKVRYVNGIGIPTKDTAAGVAADSSQILIRPADSSLYVKYKRTWMRVGGGGGSIAGSGTTNYVPKFTSSSGIGNSQIFDNGTSVGIGSTSPAGKLEVASAASSSSVGFNVGTSVSPERGNLFYHTDGTGWKFNIGKFQSSTFTAQMTFQDNGNVGIGNTIPVSKLDVNKPSQSAGGTTPSGALLVSNTAAGNGVLELGTGLSAIGWIQARNSISATYYALSLNPVGSNVLVGTSTDNGVDKLQVSGSMNVSTLATTTNISVTTNATVGGDVRVTGNLRAALIGVNTDAQSYGINIASPGNLIAYFNTSSTENISNFAHSSSQQFGRIGNASGALSGGSNNDMAVGALGASNNLILYTNSAERVRVTSAGRVLANTTTDNGVDQLQVNGSISGNGFEQAYLARTTTYTATTSDYFIDCTTGTFTVNLFTAVGNTGRILIIKNSGTGTITVDPNGTQTIDGATTQSLATQWSRVHIISDGANWKIISN